MWERLNTKNLWGSFGANGVLYLGGSYMTICVFRILHYKDDFFVNKLYINLTKKHKVDSRIKQIYKVEVFTRIF